jgi:hypothetical protein
MKKIITLLSVFLICDLVGPFFSCAEKIQNSFATDYLTQSRQQTLKRQIPNSPIIPSTSVQMPQENTMSETTTLPETTTAIPKTSKTAPPMTLAPATQTSMPQTTLAPVQQNLGSTPAVPPTASIGFNKINIKVPDYEKKLREMLRDQEIAKAKKKKTLIESIVDEITHYGFIFIMVFVVGLIIYALRKDKRTMPGPPIEKPVGLQPDEKKDIWSEEF